MREYRVTHVYDAGEGWRKVRPFGLTAAIRDDLLQRGCTMVRVRDGMFSDRKLSLIRVRDLR